MDRLTRIEHADDPRIATYLNIRDRELVGKANCFIAEGSVVLRKLLGSRAYQPQSALLLENRVAGLQDVVTEMCERQLPVFVASRGVIDAIAGFHMHRGVLAAGATIEPASPSDILAQLPEQATVVVCIGIANHDNIGAIFRNAAGLGADAVLYDRTCCNPLYRKSIRVSVGSVFDMPHACFENPDQLRATLAHHGFTQLALTPSGLTELSELPVSKKTALYLGTEGHGLPQSILDNLQGTRIDMPSGFDSLNVAAASAIALYHLRLKQIS
jgi:tRNA G18 (ribose-2'-O)-methylase SpoU